MATYEREWRDGNSTYKVGRIEEQTDGDEAADAGAEDAGEGPNNYINYGNNITYDIRGNAVVTGGPPLDQTDRTVVIRNGEVDWSQTTEGVIPAEIVEGEGNESGRAGQTTDSAAVRFTRESYGENVVRGTDSPTGAYHDAPPRSRIQVSEVALSVDEASTMPAQRYDQPTRPTPATIETLGSAGLVADYRELDDPDELGRRRTRTVFLGDGEAFTTFLDELNQTEGADREGAAVMKALNQMRQDALKDAAQQQKDKSHIIDGSTAEFFKFLQPIAERVVNSSYATPEQKKSFLNLIERSGGTNPEAGNMAQLRSLGVTEVPRPGDKEAAIRHPLLSLSRKARDLNELQQVWERVIRPLVGLKGSDNMEARVRALQMVDDTINLAGQAKAGLLPDITAGNGPTKRNFDAYAKYDALNNIIERLKAFLKG